MTPEDLNVTLEKKAGESPAPPVKDKSVSKQEVTQAQEEAVKAAQAKVGEQNIDTLKWKKASDVSKN